MIVTTKTIGVLALQGGFREHLAVFRSLDVRVREIRLPEQLSGLDGLVIPGGESTTIVKLSDLYGLRQSIQQAAMSGIAVWGTCAGLIVIARELADPYPQPFGLLDVRVARNWFGRQVHSFELDLAISALSDGPFPGVFIRAPAILSTGLDVETLASLPNGMPVAVRNGRILGTAFHPELTSDTRMHRYFLRLAETTLGDGSQHEEARRA